VIDLYFQVSHPKGAFLAVTPMGKKTELPRVESGVIHISGTKQKGITNKGALQLRLGQTSCFTPFRWRVSLRNRQLEFIRASEKYWKKKLDIWEKVDIMKI